MSRTKRFLGGVFFGYAQQVLVTLTGLWLTPFLLHHIGQHDYGLWLVGLQILTWLTLLDLGIVALLPRETAYALGRAGTVENAADLPSIIAQTTRTVLWQWPLVALVAVTCWIFLPANVGTLRGPIVIVVLAFVLGFPLRVFRAVLEGLQDLHFLGRLQILCWAAGIMVSVSLVLTGFNLYALAAGWATSQLSVALLSFVRLKLKFPYVLPASLSNGSLQQLPNQFKRGFWVSLAQIAYLLVDGTDLLIIGQTMGTVSVVPYSCTEKLIGVLSNQPTMLMHAASPGLSAIKSGGDRALAFQVVVSLTQGMLLLSGGLTCLVLAVNGAFVGWWVGPKQFAGESLTILLVLTMLLRHWNSTAVHAVFCFGHERRLSLIAVSDGVVSVAASFILVHFLGAVGAPLGSILGLCFTSLPLTLLTLSQESGKSILAVIAPLWPWFWRFLFLASASELLSSVWNPLTLLGVTLDAALVGLVYTAVMFPMLMKSSLSVYLPHRLIADWNKFIGVRPSLSA